MSWLERQLSSHNVQLAAVAVASGVAVAGTIYGVQALRREENLERLKESIPLLNETHHADLLTDYGTPSKQAQSSREEDRAAALARRAQHGDYDEDLIAEQLTRIASFLGPDRFKKLRDAFVVVVGMGGVGSHCTSALARSGVSKLRLIDFDQVTLSSLNRHAVATLTDVGGPKVDCVRKRLEAVVPWVQWDCMNEVWTESQAGRLLGPWKESGRRPDFVVDAIDNIDSKVALLRYCREHALPVISSMGAGCKSDPSRVFVGDISASIEDPLSRATRRRLRAVGIATGLPVVYSTEKPGPGKAQLLPLSEDEFQRGSVNELSVLPDFRARILPVLGTMPAVFGYTVANYVVLQITDYPHEASEGKARDKLYDQILSALQGLEERLYRRRRQINGVKPAGSESTPSDVKSQKADEAIGLKIPVNKDDVGYLVEEVFRGKSVVSGLPSRLTLIRWRLPPHDAAGDNTVKNASTGSDPITGTQKSVRLDLDELVCMTKEEAAMHEREVLLGGRGVEEVYEKTVIELVEERMKEERYYAKFR